MVIQSSTTNINTVNGKTIAKKLFTLTAYSLLIIFGIITTITVIGSNAKNPTGSYLSPLPKGELAQTTPTPTEPQKSTTELINLAQNYLNQAFDLAKTPPQQTPEQKQKILKNLDQSLNLAAQAISQDPRNPSGYVLRAQILTAVSKQNPAALSQAQKDLELAQSLSQGQPITLPQATNPLNLLPDQQALAGSDLVLAAPEDSHTSAASGELSSNSFTAKVTLPAGQTELAVANPAIADQSYIYLIPETKTNTSLFVKSKTLGRFTLSASAPSPVDLNINYYIINP